MARVAIYVRVSTDGQTTANQELELRAWAERAGHVVVEVYADNGHSGSKCVFHVIRPSVPRASGRLFHEHRATS